MLKRFFGKIKFFEKESQLCGLRAAAIIGTRALNVRWTFVSADRSGAETTPWQVKGKAIAQ